MILKTSLDFTATHDRASRSTPRRGWSTKRTSVSAPRPLATTARHGTETSLPAMELKSSHASANRSGRGTKSARTGNAKSWDSALVASKEVCDVTWVHQSVLGGNQIPRCCLGVLLRICAIATLRYSANQHVKIYYFVVGVCGLVWCCLRAFFVVAWGGVDGVKYVSVVWGTPIFAALFFSLWAPELQ